MSGQHSKLKILTIQILKQIKDTYYYKNLSQRGQGKYLVLGKPPSDGSGLLGTQIQRQVLLILVSFPQSSFLLLGNHCQNLRYWKPNHLSASIEEKTYVRKINVAKFAIQSNNTQNRRSPPIEWIKEGKREHILESLLGAPPVTLATRRRASSALRSFNWFRSSAFVLFLSSWTLILALIHSKVNPDSIKCKRRIQLKKIHNQLYMK